MPKEIERKFLVANPSLIKNMSRGVDIVQGYIHNSPDKVVRIRTTWSGTEGCGYITVKGKNEGISRDEFEYSIPYEEAKVMLDKFCEGVLKKTRHSSYHGGFFWDIDFFKDLGIVIAEVELESEDTVVPIPEWASKEVSDDPRYYNSNIVSGSLSISTEKE